MQLHINKHDDIVVIEIEGEVDLYHSPSLRKELASQINHGEKKVLLDFEKVKYIDSSGLATLIEGLQKMNKSKGKFVLCGLNSSIYDIFEVARLDGVFIVKNTQKDGLDALK
ncbi:STAS domain-containing protein [bacterium]|nr:STAS domain-containing protein [bacterium]